MNESKEQKSIQIDIKRTAPLFADNIIVANLIKSPSNKNKDKKKNRDIEEHVTILFIDSLTHQAVSRIVISKATAKNLLHSLEESLKKFDKVPTNKDSKKQQEKHFVSGQTRYLG